MECYAHLYAFIGKKCTFVAKISNVNYLKMTNMFMFLINCLTALLQNFLYLASMGYFGFVT